MIRAQKAMQPNDTRQRRWRRVLPSTAALLVLAASLSACALGSSDDGPGASAAQGDSYPNLARVPNEAPRPTPEDLRESLLQGLIADRANARYTDEVLTNESTAVPPAPPPPKGRQRVEIAWATPRKLTKEQVQDELAPPVLVEITWVTDRVELEPEPASAVAPPAAPLEPVVVIWNETPVEPGPAAAEAIEVVWNEVLMEPEPAAAPAEVTTAAGPGGKQLVAILQFAEASSELNEQDREVLGVVLALQQESGGRLHLVGYSDSPVKADDPVEQRTAGLYLSLERAAAVASTLVGLGADQDSLLVEASSTAQPGFGEPASADAANSQADSRIVEIFLEY